MANFINACNAFHDACEVVHHFKLRGAALQHFKHEVHFIKKFLKKFLICMTALKMGGFLFTLHNFDVP